jgi:hypothetical protein
MNTLLRSAGVAAVAAAAWMATAAATPASASPQAGVTQELSAACRTVVTHRWSGGRRVTVRKRVCTPGYVARPAYAGCRYVVKYRYDRGRRISVRTRVC